MLGAAPLWVRAASAGALTKKVSARTTKYNCNILCRMRASSSLALQKKPHAHQPPAANRRRCPPKLVTRQDPNASIPHVSHLPCVYYYLSYSCFNHFTCEIP